jgi:hypothetical protein
MSKYIYISTNNIARGMVRVREIRFQPTKNTFSLDQVITHHCHP